MKNFFIIVLFSLSGFAFAEAPQCTIENYRDIVFQDNAEPPKCDLRDADLRGADLYEADLRGADLRFADLGSFWPWLGADLRFADLREADLRHTNFRYADLQSADLQGADLRGAILRGAKLRDVNLQDANLTGALVTPKQARYFKTHDYDLTGFFIMDKPRFAIRLRH